VSDPTAGECRKALKKSLTRTRKELASEMEAARESIEQAMSFGQLGEEDRSAMADELVTLKHRLAGPVTVADAKFRLGRIQVRLDAFKEDRCREARERFKRINLSETDGAQHRIAASIDSGDLLTANELMGRVEAGEPLSPLKPPIPDAFSAFFPETATLVEASRDESGGKRARNLIAIVKNRGRTNGLSFEELDEGEAHQAADLLELWLELDRSRSPGRAKIEKLFVLIGFQLHKVTITGKGRERVDATLETEPLQDRMLCPLPAFGSNANGRYDVVLAWGQRGVEAVTQAIGEGRTRPTIVLYFGRLGEERTRLGEWARDRHHQFLVIDETLLLFLCSRRGSRLLTMFQCTLPFSSAEPFVTTSGMVPPELFYGRARERAAVRDALGGCFIYGGRQLGKTALLRAVEREFHEPERRHIAKWLDLKVYEIGLARDPSEIWPLLWRALQKLKVIDRSHAEPNPGNNRHVDALLEAIERWITEHGERRLLLLLDEADAFLEQDARSGYQESTRLKGLMDRTDRRFKVVFAGLHNVLRTTEQANHPLAHLGEPINIGPLLSNGEWHEAHALVREPLSALGYRFERDELPTRILAQTNYYPSLIQLYGAELVRRLRNTVRGDPPYVVRASDVDETYGSAELRDAIRERFLLTLQLDQRYEVIAYTVAFEFLSGDCDLASGVDRGVVRESAQSWWPEGFSESEAEFTTLLDEMVGLGLLRTVTRGDRERYTLRNPNVLLLLGGTDEITLALEKEREPPQPFEPVSFHARYGGETGASARRGPLTYQQEANLRTRRNGVTVIAGTPAAGIGEVGEFLGSRLDAHSFMALPAVPDLIAFEKAIKTANAKLLGGVTVWMVPPAAPWSSEWLSRARARLARLKSKDRWVRIVFIADPPTLWQVMSDIDEEIDLDVEWLYLDPWKEAFLGHWLEDCNLPGDPHRRAQLIEASGGWSHALNIFQRDTKRSWDQRLKEFSRQVDSDVGAAGWLEQLGITEGEPRRALVALAHIEPFGEDILPLVAAEASLDSQQLRARVNWAQRIGLLSPPRNGSWSFNPLVKRALSIGSG